MTESDYFARPIAEWANRLAAAGEHDEVYSIVLELARSLETVAGAHHPALLARRDLYELRRDAVAFLGSE